MKENGKISSQSRDTFGKSLYLRRSLVIGALVGGLALSGCQDRKPSAENTDTSAAPSVAASDGKGLVSAEPNSFNEVAAQLDRGGSLYGYISTEKFMSEIGTQVGTIREVLMSGPKTGPGATSDADLKEIDLIFNAVTNFFSHSGLGKVTGVGASSFALEPGLYRNKLFLHHYAGKGDGPFWTAFGKAPRPLTELDLLPTNTALAGFTDFSPAEIINFLRREVEQSNVPEAKKGLDQAIKEFPGMAGMTLDEALASLGNSVGFVVTLDPAKPLELPIPDKKVSIPTPRVALLLQVKDDRIFKRIDQILEGNPGMTKVDEANLRMRTIPSPMPPPFELQPTLALWGGYLIVASDRDLVRDIIAAKTTGKGFKSTADFAKLSEGLPTEGNGFQLATAVLGETINRVQREVAKGDATMTAQQTALIEKLMGNQKPGNTYSVNTHLPNGWLMVSKGNQGVGQVLAPAVAVPAVLAGMALPVFGEVRERATATKSLSNAKQIGTACKIYAVDFAGKYPPNLAALVPDYLPDADIFISPFAPDEPNGYTYRAGLNDTSAGTIVLIEDKFASREGKRVVIYADGRGEILPVK